MHHQSWLFPGTPDHVPNVQLVCFMWCPVAISEWAHPPECWVLPCESAPLPSPRLPFSFHTHTLFISTSYGSYLQKKSVFDHFSASHWDPCSHLYGPMVSSNDVCSDSLLSFFPTSHSQHSIQRNHLKHELVHNLSLNRTLQRLLISLRVKLKSKNVWQGPTTFCLSLNSSLATAYSHT